MDHLGSPARITVESCGLTFFSIISGFVKTFLKTIKNEKKKHNKIVTLARTKLNSRENKISKALMEMKLVMKTLRQLLMKKKNIEN